MKGFSVDKHSGNQLKVKCCENNVSEIFNISTKIAAELILARICNRISFGGPSGPGCIAHHLLAL